MPPIPPPYRKYYDKKMTDRQIAEATGRSRGAVTRWRRENGLPPHHPRLSRREQIARSSEKERRLFRQFMNDLLNFAEDCPKPNISKFINVWREEKGERMVAGMG